MYFPWGKVIERFHYDFDNDTLAVTKYHPWTRSGANVNVGTPSARIAYHVEALSESFDNMDTLLIAWIVNKHLGHNQRALVEGICRALFIPPQTNLYSSTGVALRARLEDDSTL